MESINFRIATLSLLLLVPFCLLAQNTGVDQQTSCDPGWKVAVNGGCERNTASKTQPVADQIRADQIKVGQTMTEVHALIGKPNRPAHRQQWEEWNTPSDGKQVLEVQYDKDGIVLWAHKFIDQSRGSSEKDKIEEAEIANRDQGAGTQSKAANVVDRVATAAQGVMLTHDCPRVYQTPLIFMNANDVQWLQACNANGFMLFGMYVFTGAKR
jgi:hypothetical protein